MDEKQKVELTPKEMKELSDIEFYFTWQQIGNELIDQCARREGR